MIGVFVNFFAVIIGSLIGILFKKGMSEKIVKSVTEAVSLAIVYVGISGVIKGKNALVLVISMVVGALIGTLLDLDAKLEKLGKWVENKLSRESGEGKIAEGFVSASLLFCVGAMAIVGSLQSGLVGNHETLFTKSMIDLISAVVLASALGIGVIFSAVPVLILQGSIALLAQFVAPFLSDYAVNEMTCAGSLIILSLGLNMLGVTKVKVVNLVPAVFVPIILCMFM